MRATLILVALPALLLGGCASIWVSNLGETCDADDDCAEGQTCRDMGCSPDVPHRKYCTAACNDAADPSCARFEGAENPSCRRFGDVFLCATRTTCTAF